MGIQIAHLSVSRRLASFFAVLCLPIVTSLPNERQAISTNSTCRYLPGDVHWPSISDWSKLNVTVEGRLIAALPMASVCHDPNYDDEQCKTLRENWIFADAHIQSPTSVVAPWFQKGACIPFTSRDTPCSYGNYALYSINVSSVQHVQAAVQFAREKNIRLSIKNTGHDLLGKSTGKGSLSLWMHHLDSIQFDDDYIASGNYSGPVVRIGAGVLTRDANAAAHSRGLRIITGTCPTVAVAGGYTAGGGHGVFTSVNGLAADNVLAWEVVTADGSYLNVTPNSHPDLYWALSGGGSGTFAVIISMVVRVYRDVPMGGATLAFDVGTCGSLEKFWHAVVVFQAHLGHIVDAGAVVSYSLTSSSFTLYGIAISEGNATTAANILRRSTEAMEEIGVTLQITTTSHDNYLDFFNQYFSEAVTKTPHAQLTGGRLVPRSLIEAKCSGKKVAQAFRFAVDSGFTVICNAINADRPHMYANAVLPAWRSALLHCIFVKSWDFSISAAEMTAYQARLTDTIMPRIEAATPGGGAYLNEANFQEANWQQTFYGQNYARLKDIKYQVDPFGVFYAQTAVGSDTWVEDSAGRLCRL